MGAWPCEFMFRAKELLVARLRDGAAVPSEDGVCVGSRAGVAANIGDCAPVVRMNTTTRKNRLIPLLIRLIFFLK